LDKLAKEIKPAVAYLRTSSAANVGADKDSEKRQRKAIADYARTAGYAIVEEFYDAVVSGADPVHERKGFAAMLARIAGNGVRVILVETASRFARDILVQETGHRYLKELGVELRQHIQSRFLAPLRLRGLARSIRWTNDYERVRSR
jgi:DNA invertase Pin-like site-specific DNA recombinase